MYCIRLGICRKCSLGYYLYSLLDMKLSVLGWLCVEIYGTVELVKRMKIGSGCIFRILPSGEIKVITISFWWERCKLMFVILSLRGQLEYISFSSLVGVSSGKYNTCCSIILKTANECFRLFYCCLCIELFIKENLKNHHAFWALFYQT